VRQSKIALPQGQIDTAWWGPGPEDAATIVLLHEGLGSVGLWRDFPQKLAEATGCGVFAYSRHGYGHSAPAALPRPLDYLAREGREVLPLVLHAAGIQHAILLGHSDGASIAAAYAGSVQDFDLLGLVLIAPHFFTEQRGLDAIAEAGTLYREGGLRARLARHHADPDNAFFGWHDAWRDPGYPMALDLLPDVAHIRVPILAMQSAGDAYGTLAQIDALKRHTYCPVETLILPGTSHAPQFDDADAVLTTVQDFTARALRMANLNNNA